MSKLKITAGRNLHGRLLPDFEPMEFESIGDACEFLVDVMEKEDGQDFSESERQPIHDKLSEDLIFFSPDNYIYWIEVGASG